MPKFDATWMPDPLNWDFTGFPGFEQTEKGVTPEPTGKMLRDFLRKMQALEKDKLPSLGTPSEWLRVLMDEGSESMIEIANSQVADLVGEVCQDCPSAEQFRRLPDGAKPLFLDYLIKNLVNPNGRGAGSKESQKAPDNGVSGISPGVISATE